MGSSGYLAAKSEAEVHAHQIEMERHEMRLMPDLEEEELALIYEAKGLPPERARETARHDDAGSGAGAGTPRSARSSTSIPRSSRR